MSSDSRVSRRDFLKFLGASGIVLALGGLGSLALSDPKRKGSPTSSSNSLFASAQTAGSWVQGQNTTTVAIHANLLHNGKILYIAGSGYHRSHFQGPFEARLLDPTSGVETEIPLDDDIFCHGSTLLPNGNVLIAGGTLSYDGNPDSCNGKWKGFNDVYEYDVTSGAIVEVSPMAAGRWYPTLMSLADGSAVIFEGFDEYGAENRLVEFYNTANQSWTIKYNPQTSLKYCVGEGSEADCPGAGTVCYGGSAGHGVAPKMANYVRMHLMPSGLIVSCGQHATVRSFDPATGIFKLLTNQSTYRHYGSSFLLPLNNTTTEKGKILAVGGSVDASANATGSSDILDFNASTTDVPVVRAVQPLSYPRKFMMPVILPDGKCVLFGGSSYLVRNYVYYPEMFNPVTETWTTLAPAAVPRSYHGVAVLLTDGTVWLAGSTPTSSVWELRTEIFRPWYYNESRPTISGSPMVGAYGNSITIPTPNAANISSVSLVRLMSTTHHFEPNQRHLWLQVQNKTSDSVIVKAPLSGNLAPPGYYMIHVLYSNGVPSPASIIKIPGSGTGTVGDTQAPSQVSGLVATGVGSNRIDLSWNANPEPDVQHYNVYRGTTAGFPVNTATDAPLAQPAGLSFSDTGLGGATTYYYKVAAVDTSSNIGPISTEASAATAEVFYNVAGPGNVAAGIYAGSSVRYGVEARIATSAIVGKALKSWTVYLRRVGSPSGPVTATVRRKSDDSVVAAFSQTIASNSLPTTFAPFTFTLPASYVIQNGDRILIEYAGPNRIDISIWNTDKIDGDRTRRVRYAGTSYTGGNTEDCAGTMSS